MIERYFTIKDFRSIGVDDIQYFDLNYLLDNHDSYGGLVTIIGENNSGKSNVLDAIKAFGLRKFEKDDIPYHNLKDNIEPEICLYLKDHLKDYKAVVKMKGNNRYFSFCKGEKQVHFMPEPTKKLSKNSEDFVIYMLSESVRSRVAGNSRIYNVYNVLAPIFTKLSSGEIINSNELSRLNEHLPSTYFSGIINERFTQNTTADFIADVSKAFIASSSEEIEKQFIEETNKIFNVKVYPKVIEYLDSNKIKRSDTTSPVTNGNIMKPDFFLKMYDLLDGLNFDELKNAYLNFHQSAMQKVFLLTNYERKINSELEKLSKQFNEIYSFNGSNKYKFWLKLESNMIYFMISENNVDIYLDSQSTGFKWFFDFFFNVFADKKIEAGDIVILDEPATHLHVSGQIELRKQIKDFGMRSGITFVVSTHSPFLVNPDYLDEVRIVKKTGAESKIINKFTMDEKDIDVMMPIKTALTVNRHILMNPEDTLVFVEGVTDYNYLVMSKMISGIESITFMPIQGIKRSTLYRDLLKITKTPILLVDSDGAGKYVYDKYKDVKGFEVIRLEDIKSEFDEIESLFSDQDKLLFTTSDKNYKSTSALKNAVVQKRIKLSKDSQNNFRLVLDRLIQ